jgi:mannose-6-phosphate isomerase-like protein (cupin superfamily)
MKKIVKASDHTEFYTDEKCFISELLNSETFNSFSIAQARVLPGITTSLHRLRDVDEVYYILSGKGEMEVEDETKTIVEEKDIVFIPRNKTQRITNISGTDLIFLCVCSPRFRIEAYESIYF